MAVRIRFRVFLAPDSRELLFGKSVTHDGSDEKKIRVVELRNCDLTGTNEFCEMIITRDSLDDCMEEMREQIMDGLFKDHLIKNVSAYSTPTDDWFDVSMFGKEYDSKESVRLLEIEEMYSVVETFNTMGHKDLNRKLKLLGTYGLFNDIVDEFIGSKKDLSKLIRAYEISYNAYKYRF